MSCHKSLGLFLDGLYPWAEHGCNGQGLGISDASGWVNKCAFGITFAGNDCLEAMVFGYVPQGMSDVAHLHSGTLVKDLVQSLDGEFIGE